MEQDGRARRKQGGGVKSEKAPGLEGFTKFPRTRHIFDAGGTGVGRDDLLMDEREAREYYEATVSIEEKIDGSNLGISVTPEYELRFQNRSHYVNKTSAAQWKGLDSWVSQHPGLWDVLTPDIILFGEWMAHCHSVLYTRLPGYFVAFDIYDKTQGSFLSRVERDQRLEGSGIPVVPLLGEGVFGREAMEALLDSDSAWGDGKLEGIYVRIDEGQWLKKRAKVVRADFIQGIQEHYSKREPIPNRVAY